MNMKNHIGLSLVYCLGVSNVVLLHSAAWGECTVQERIELGNQGYDKEKVEKICADAGQNDGENFWESLGKDVMKNLTNGLSDSLSKGLDKGLSSALGVRERTSTAASPTPQEARECVTIAGICPLSGVPVGAQCYCQAWNGATFYGVSK
jgi:hypothetical protein